MNDPYDGDWALNPLGGKQIKMQVDPARNLSRSFNFTNLHAYQALPMLQTQGAQPRLQSQQAVPPDNIWNDGVSEMTSIAAVRLELNHPDSQVMGTNSIFMHSMSSKDANANLMTKRAQKQPR